MFVPPVPIASLGVRAGQVTKIDYFTGAKALYLNPDHGIVAVYGLTTTTRSASLSDVPPEHCMSVAGMNDYNY